MFDIENKTETAIAFMKLAEYARSSNLTLDLSQYGLLQVSEITKSRMLEFDTPHGKFRAKYRINILDSAIELVSISIVRLVIQIASEVPSD